VYALIRTFCANHVRFHAADGSGYDFLAEAGAGARQAESAGGGADGQGVRSLEKIRRNKESACAGRPRASPRRRGLSRDVAEIVGKALA